MAAQQGLVNAKKHESQDICFVPDGDYAAFIRRHTGKTYPHGPFLDQEGHVLGEHTGIVAIPWASAGDWGYPPTGDGCMSSRSGPRTTPWFCRTTRPYFPLPSPPVI